MDNNTLKLIKEAKNDIERAEIIGKQYINSIETSSSKMCFINVVDNKSVKRLAESLGIICEHQNIELDFKLSFSKTNLKESISKQLSRFGNASSFVKLLYVFDEVIKNSQLIEIHKDIYKGTVFESKDFELAYVLLSAFYDEEYIYPVEILVKKNVGENGRIHMIITVGSIKKANIIPEGKHNANLTGPFTTYKVTDLISFVNDGDFLKYVPDQLLNNKQMKLKKTAIKKENDKISKYRNK